MGACTNGEQSNSRRGLSQKDQDIQNYDPFSPNKFEFKCCLSKVSIESIIEKYSTSMLSVSFTIIDIVDILSPSLPVKDKRIKWKINASFLCSMNDYEMRSKFLMIEVSESTKKILTKLQINLFSIITGPSHYDLKLEFKNKAYGRLRFDLKMDQLVSFTLKSARTEIQFAREYLGEKFNFTLQSYSKEASKHKKNAVFQTIPSYTQEVPLLQDNTFRPINQQDEAPSPTFRLKKKATLIKVEGFSTVRWSLDEKDQMPALQVKIKATEMLSSSFGFKLYKFVNGTNISEFGYLPITLSELLISDPISPGLEQQQQRSARLQKNIWQNGKPIGKCFLEMKIKNSKFYKQMSAQTQTEDGIVNMSHFQFYESVEGQEKSGLEELTAHYQKLLQLYNRTKFQASFIEIRKMNSQILEQLQRMHETLVKYLNSSYIFHQKSSHTKMAQKQVLLLKIMKLLSLYIEEQDLDLCEICWKNVIEILKRGELMLRHWKFTEEERKIIEEKKCKPAALKEKIEISFLYWETLHELMTLCLNSDAIDSQRVHSEIFKVYCYFRVPYFRRQFLSSIVQDLNFNTFEDHYIEEISLQKNLNTESIKIKDIDWDYQFFKILLEEERGKSLDFEVSMLLNNHNWFIKLANKDELFFNFIRFFMAKLNLIRQSELTPKWYYFPGYIKIVDSFIQVMRDSELQDYSYEMILAAISLLENQRLFPSMLRVIYSKTNIYNQNSVMKMLDILSNFLHITFKRNPSSFPYTYFMNGIKILMQLDCVISLSQTLILLYNFYDNFDAVFRYELSLYLTGSLFWKFFYHWSYNVRRVYMHIIILRICQDTELKITTDIQNRLIDLFTIVSNSEETVIKFNAITNKKSTVFHKKMGEKLRKNRLKVLRKQNDQGQGISIKDLIRQSSPQYKIQMPNFEHRISQTNIESLQNEGVLMKTKNFNFDPSETLDITELKESKALKRQLSYRNQKFIYNCFTQQQLSANYHSLSMEIIVGIAPYLQPSAKQFKEILKLVDEHFRNTGSLPVVRLGLQIQIDEKDILPSGFNLFFD